MIVHIGQYYFNIRRELVSVPGDIPDPLTSFLLPLPLSVHSLSSNSTGKHASCHMYDYNYTAVSEMGYDAVMADRSSFSRGSDDPIKCYSRDFNLTQYQSTVVTEVSSVV